jgi:hypothetical protein
MQVDSNSAGNVWPVAKAIGLLSACDKKSKLTLRSPNSTKLCPSQRRVGTVLKQLRFIESPKVSHAIGSERG